MSLVGKYFYLSEDDEYRTGRVEEQVEAGAYLVSFFCDVSCPVPWELWTLEQIAAPTRHAWEGWSFFPTREDLDKWLVWLETPRVSEVISLVRN